MDNRPQPDRVGGNVGGCRRPPKGNHTWHKEFRGATIARTDGKRSMDHSIEFGNHLVSDRLTKERGSMSTRREFLVQTAAASVVAAASPQVTRAAKATAVGPKTSMKTPKVPNTGLGVSRIRSAIR